MVKRRKEEFELIISIEGFSVFTMSPNWVSAFGLVCLKSWCTPLCSSCSVWVHAEYDYCTSVLQLTTWHDGLLIISEMILLHCAVSNPSPPTMEEKEVRSPSPNIILRRDNDFLSPQKSAWDSSSDGEEEAEVPKVPDVCRDDLASRRAQRSPIAPKVHQFVPPPVCSKKDQERWEGIRRASQQMQQEREIRSAMYTVFLGLLLLVFHFL